MARHSEGKKAPAARRVRVPLVVKMIGIISIIVVLSTGIVTGLSSWFFSDDSRARAEDNALTLSQVVAAQMQSEITAVYSGALSLFDVLRESAGNRTLAELSIADYLARNPSIAYIRVPQERDASGKDMDLAAAIQFLDTPTKIASGYSSIGMRTPVRRAHSRASS